MKSYNTVVRRVLGGLALGLLLAVLGVPASQAAGDTDGLRGFRVPCLLISPFAPSATVAHTVFDHTSVLQFLAEVFTPGRPYSSEVDARARQGVNSIAAILGERARADVPKVPADPIPVTSALGGGVKVRPTNGLQASFELAASQLMVAEPVAMARKYPDLFQWKAAVDAERRQM